MARKAETFVEGGDRELQGIDWEVMKELKWESIRQFMARSKYSQRPPIRSREIPKEVKIVLELVYLPGFKRGYEIGKQGRDIEIIENIKWEWIGPLGGQDIYVKGVEEGFKIAKLIKR